MNNQRKQQLFNQWYDMTCDEHIRYCSEDGCIGFIKEQPDYDESDDYDNLVSQMQQVIGNNYYLFPEISVHYNERANKLFPIQKKKSKLNRNTKDFKKNKHSNDLTRACHKTAQINFKGDK